MFVSEKDFQVNQPDENKFESACLGMLSLTFPMPEQKRLAVVMHIRQGVTLIENEVKYADTILKARLDHDMTPYLDQFPDRKLATDIVDHFVTLLANKVPGYSKSVEELCQGILVPDSQRKLMISQQQVMPDPSFERQKS